ncbi:Uma2 family endonuclease [Streptomyces mexicanus]|jgi:Uma2 family endonuclease|uniref:Uma2 family endonuclease n=1 Tax=Streptomyces mexicanus TaxID=178566 RepID=UPI00369CD874
MTPDTEERPQMSVEDFEELVRRAPRELRNRLELLGGRLCIRHGPLDVEEFEELAAAAPETVRLEYVNRKVVVKARPDGNHGEIFMWLLRQCMQQRPELNLMPERGVKAEAYRKDRAITDGFLAPVSHFKGPMGYAAAGIPVYLLIDRDSATVSVYSEPKDGRYLQCSTRPWGATGELPPRVDITLDTERLKDYAESTTRR